MKKVLLVLSVIIYLLTSFHFMPVIAEEQDGTESSPETTEVTEMEESSDDIKKTEETIPEEETVSEDNFSDDTDVIEKAEDNAEETIPEEETVSEDNFSDETNVIEKAEDDAEEIIPEENEYSDDKAVIEKTEEESLESENIEESVNENEDVYSTGNSYSEPYVLHLDQGISIQSEGSEKFFKFTPSRSGQYTFSSSGDSDTTGCFYYDYPGWYVEDDDSGENLNFSVTYDLIKGRDYYLCVSGYNQSSFSCTVSVTADSYDAVRTVSITFDINYDKGGRYGDSYSDDFSDSSTRVIEYEYGEDTTNNLGPSNVNYKDSSRLFVGWADRKDAVKPQYNGYTNCYFECDTFYPTEDTVLYAVYMPVHTVTFIPGNGFWVETGTEYISPSDKSKNLSFTVFDQKTFKESPGPIGNHESLEIMCNTGVFKGWSTTSDGKNIVNINNYRFTKNMTFYAVFQKTTGWKKVNDNWYYFNANGVLQKGWQKIDGKWYYFNSDGVMQTYWTPVGNNWYYLGSNGAMRTGWISYTSGGYTTWFYCNSSGAAVTGWQKIDGKWYYLRPETRQMVTGLEYINGKPYYFSNSGAMLTGWQKAYGNWYYFSNSGAAVIGWQKIKNKWYYFDSNIYNKGVMLTGWQKISNKWYYMSSSGVMQTGWIKLGGNWYYLTGSGAMVTGWQKIKGKWYYFGSSGDMYYQGWYEINGKRYWFKNNGEMISGWGKILDDEVAGGFYWVYCNSNGVGYTGWIQDGDDWYYAEKGDLYYGMNYINGILYCFDDYTGIMKKDIFVYEKEHTNTYWPYHFDADGKGTNGWLEYGWYYYHYVNGYPVDRQ